MFLKVPPQQLVLQGSVANIPFVTGDQHQTFYFPVYRLIRLLQVTVTTKEPFSVSPASTLREWISDTK